ncbi:SDR family NAD(P)-dependent oxidoreductase [Cuneatibacter caecimuris]|uniref:3-oxoacyl-[acyl-carrier protein] reductase n=1 Tax=Cuneatibacter caecimuris TaxID=1796618 RepID=A0A4Q7PJ08_9FIRM|nr:glucose 1-dehydrogenase [Cuneatibacter caecimuris]RZT00587.1 3-oxoacyl-[acyl-carrier protein] reductase [Cuneatibacter caecimuris]
MGKLQDKVAIVTGATSGIGTGVMECFLEEGAKVVFCGRREEKGKAIEKELQEKGYDVTFVRADMTDSADVANLFQKTLDTYGKLDILVNNAGVLKSFEIANMDVESDLDQVIGLNLKSYFVATKFAANAMKDGGAIINVASIGGLSGAPHLSSYGATKAGVLSLTRSMAKELAPMNIRTNAICPGTIYSEMMQRDSEFTKATLATIPMGRGGEPREIGTVAVFLASEDSSYVTGTSIVVDGGMTA